MRSDLRSDVITRAFCVKKSMELAAGPTGYIAIE